MLKFLAKSFVNYPTFVNTATSNIATNAYLELESSLIENCVLIHVNNGTIRYLTLAVGAAGAEVKKITIEASKQAVYPIRINKGSRVSVIANITAASSGFLIVNFLG